MVEKFQVAHISDLHFSEGTVASNPNHSHSLECLGGLVNTLKPMDNLDRLVVSGDISNSGDEESLNTAYTWIFDKFSLGGGQFLGLEFPTHKVGVVPGNHDAWNASASGKMYERRQKSLENYNKIFVHHKVDPEIGCYYDWIESGSDGIFLAFVDSCFMGEHYPSDGSTTAIPLVDKIARGNVSIKQSEQILEWCDLGIFGRLCKPGKPEEFIGKDVFSRSLKIIIMHHYLFEPPGHSDDYFMSLKDRDTVFRNFALSDFDLLLCGHKHVSGFYPLKYGEHIDAKARDRYIFNYFRRLIGLHSLPIRYVGEKGRFFGRVLNDMANILVMWYRRKNGGSGGSDYVDQVIDALRKGLENPSTLEKTLKKCVEDLGRSGCDIIDKEELNEIRKRISVGLNQQERSRLNRQAEKLKDLSKSLASRAFVQSMSGSSAKSATGNNKARSFKIYRIEADSDKWTLQADRYDWDWSTKEFDSKPFTEIHVFERNI